MMRNKKAIQMPIQTVAIFVLVLAALSLLFTYFVTGARTGGAGFEEIFTGPAEQTNKSQIVGDIQGASRGGKCTGDTIPNCGRFYQTLGGLRSAGGDCGVDHCSDIGCAPVDTWGRIEQCWWRDSDLDTHGPECCSGGEVDCSVYTRLNNACGNNEDGYNEWHACDYRGRGRCVECSDRDSCRGYGANSEAKCSDFTERGKEYCECAGCRWTEYHVD